MNAQLLIDLRQLSSDLSCSEKVWRVCGNAADEIDRLQSLVTELEKDKARLNWCIDNGVIKHAFVGVIMDRYKLDKTMEQSK